jgi:hypothetical protein
MNQDTVYLKIKRAAESDKECCLCLLEDEIERRYIDTYLLELVMDPTSRQKIIESRGFCNDHYYKMLIAATKPESPDGHGIALINRSVIDALIQDLQKLKRNRNADQLYKLVADENKCPACIHLSEFSKMYAEEIIKILSSNNEESLAVLNESKGFCVPHFVSLLCIAEEAASTDSQKAVKALIEIEEKNLRRLSSQLIEYVRKQSYEFSEKERKAVSGAMLRSLEKIAGRRGIKPLIDRKREG